MGRLIGYSLSLLESEKLSLVVWLRLVVANVVDYKRRRLQVLASADERTGASCWQMAVDGHS